MYKTAFFSAIPDSDLDDLTSVVSCTKNGAAYIQGSILFAPTFEGALLIMTPPNFFHDPPSLLNLAQLCHTRLPGTVLYTTRHFLAKMHSPVEMSPVQM